jgi:hypothetical protein
VTTWRDPHAGPILHAQLRRALVEPERLELLRSLCKTLIVPRIAAAFDLPSVNIAAALEMLHGLVVGTTVIMTGPLADAPDNELVAIVTPAVVHCVARSGSIT